MRRSRISLLTALMSLSAVSVSGCRSAQKHSEPDLPDSSATHVYEASPDYHDSQIAPPEDSRQLRGPSPVPEPPRVPPALGVSHVKRVGFASRVGEKISRPFGFTTPNATADWAAEEKCAEGTCTDTDPCADPLECAEPQACTEPAEGCSIPECAPAKKPLGTRFMDTLKAPARFLKSRKSQDCVTEDDGCVPAAECRIGCTTPFPKRYFQHETGPCGEETGCGCSEFPVSAELRKELTRQTLADSMPDPLLDHEDTSDLTAEPLIPITSPQADAQVAFGAFEKIPATMEPTESLPVLDAIVSEPVPVEQQPINQPAQTGLPLQKADDVPLWPRLLPQPEIQKQPLKSTPSVPMNTTTPVRQISTGGNGLPVIQPRQFP